MYVNEKIKKDKHRNRKHQSLALSEYELHSLCLRFMKHFKTQMLSFGSSRMWTTRSMSMACVVKEFKALVMHSDFEFLASAVCFLSTVATPQLSFPGLNDVVNSVKSDLWKHPFVHSLDGNSWATNGRRSCCSGKVDPGHRTLNGKKIHRLGLSCWCCPVQVPCLLDTDINAEGKEWPPPLLRTDGDSVLVYILVHSVDATHGLVVMFDQEWLCDVYSLSFSS